MEKCPPVLLIIFNRPDLTQQVFGPIRDAKPSKLFIAADGPRSFVSSDAEKCEQTRQIIELVDWNCEVHTLFHETNLGCKHAVVSAIEWFFNHVEYGIILEDDCLSSINFFPFCGLLLEKYRDDERIGMISGNNFGFDLYDKTLSYSFSKHGGNWGWATWKRCWEKFDADLRFLNPSNVNLIKSNISDNNDFVNHLWRGVDAVLCTNLDTWDYQWEVIKYVNNYLTIRSRVNLVANIGFGESATHTKGKPMNEYTITGNLEFPLVHPDIVVPDHKADEMLERFYVSTFYKKRGFLLSIMKRIIGRISRYLIWLKKVAWSDLS